MMMSFNERVTAITDKLWDDYSDEEKDVIRKGALERMINKALPIYNELSDDFLKDLSIFLEQLERADIIPENLTDYQKQKINDLMNETVEFLIERKAAGFE